MSTVILFISLLYSLNPILADEYPKDTCSLLSDKVFERLEKRDWTDPANPAYRRPKAMPFCKVVFNLCPRKHVKTFRNMGMVKELRFSLKSNYDLKKYACRYIVPAAINRGGKDDPYFLYFKV